MGPVVKQKLGATVTAITPGAPVSAAHANVVFPGAGSIAHWTYARCMVWPAWTKTRATAQKWAVFSILFFPVTACPFTPSEDVENSVRWMNMGLNAVATVSAITRAVTTSCLPMLADQPLATAAFLMTSIL